MKDKKITKATFKSFVKKNKNNLHIQMVGSFDGMSDCVEYTPKAERQFIKASLLESNEYEEHRLGYRGIWLVNSGHDHFSHYEDNHHEGIKIFNCCGSSIVAIPKHTNQ